jgi:cytochrome b subunit of formate dehydrogenase
MSPSDAGASAAKRRANAKAAGLVSEIADADGTVLRFDIHQRLQHAILAVSFILLVLTGWPLHTYGIGASHVLVTLFGGLEACGNVHRAAAGGLVTACIYHLLYAAVLLKRRAMPPSMIPMPRDIQDFIGNLLFFLGLRRERPRFPRFSYFEKFDYWAVFWGVVIMVGSGLIRWFPETALKILPAWVYEIAYFAHADEALLAALAIFVWHFYNTHLRPAVFPMSWIFITGRLTLKELAEEHGAEYDELVAQRSHETEKGAGKKGARAAAVDESAES